jgi:hypothetical protein
MHQASQKSAGRDDYGLAQKIYVQVCPTTDNLTIPENQATDRGLENLKVRLQL